LITRSQFTAFVLQEYDQNLNSLNQSINKLFFDIDHKNRKGGLNFNQFTSLLNSETLIQILGGDISGLYKRLLINESLEDQHEIRGLFDDALEFLEES